MHRKTHEMMASLSWLCGGHRRERPCLAPFSVEKQRAVKADLFVLLFFLPLCPPLWYSEQLPSGRSHTQDELSSDHVVIRKHLVDMCAVAPCRQNWCLISAFESCEVSVNAGKVTKAFNGVFQLTFFPWNTWHPRAWDSTAGM